MLKTFAAFAASLLIGLAGTSACASSYDDAVAATIENNPEQLEPLLKKGLDPNLTTNGGTGEPLLMLAMRNNSGKVIDLLLEQPAVNIDRPNALGETPLMIAVFTKNNKLAQKLIQKGAKVNNPGKWSALHYAASAGNTDIIRTLLDKGADVNAKTLRGITPLYMAAREADTKTVRMLLQAGADKSFRNNDNLSAYDIAKMRNQPSEMLNLLDPDKPNQTK